MKLLKKLFNDKYHNRIDKKIRDLEIQLLQVKMNRITLYSNNPKLYAQSLVKQDKITDNINLLKSLL